MQQRSRTVIILILGSLTSVSPFSIDMYLPAFKQIALDFGTTAARVSLSVTSYFIGLAIGQLLYGPLLDRFGRKIPLYIGLGCYIIASIGCTQAQTIEALVAFRFVQALGGCVAMVAAVAMVRDFFSIEEGAKVFSLLLLILGSSPLLAPTVGGFIASAFGWKWIFIVLAIIVAIIMLLTFAYLPNKYRPDHTISLRAGPMFATFYSILSNRQFLTYTLAGAFSFGTMFIYVAGSPVIFLQVYKLSPEWYGGLFALLSVGFIGSSQLNILALRFYKSERIFSVALLCQLIVAVIFVVGSWYNLLGLPGTIVLFFLSLCCLGFTYPNASALALAPFTKNLGSGSALLGFLQIGIAGLLSGGVAIFDAHDQVPVVAMMAATAFIAFGVLKIGSTKRTTGI